MQLVGREHARHVHHVQNGSVEEARIGQAAYAGPVQTLWVERAPNIAERPTRQRLVRRQIAYAIGIQHVWPCESNHLADAIRTLVDPEHSTFAGDFGDELDGGVGGEHGLVPEIDGSGLRASGQGALKEQEQAPSHATTADREAASEVSEERHAEADEEKLPAARGDAVGRVCAGLLHGIRELRELRMQPSDQVIRDVGAPRRRIDAPPEPQSETNRPTSHRATCRHAPRADH